MRDNLSFYMYAGPAFPSPDALLGCRGLKRLAPLNEPMAQFYSELALHRQLAVDPRVWQPASLPRRRATPTPTVLPWQRTLDPDAASLFYVPLLPHLDQDAGSCNRTGHRARMGAAAAALLGSPHWHRRNGTDHFWSCACVMMKSMLPGGAYSFIRPAHPFQPHRQLVGMVLQSSGACWLRRRTRCIRCHVSVPRPPPASSLCRTRTPALLTHRRSTTYSCARTD